MHMMNDVLCGHFDDFILVFLDDILVYSPMVEHHAKHLGKVIGHLEDASLVCQGEQMQYHGPRNGVT